MTSDDEVRGHLLPHRGGGPPAHQLADLSVDGIVVVDADDLVVFANPAMAELVGFGRPGELTGRRFGDLAGPGREAGNGERRRREVLAGAVVHGSQEWMRHRDGTIVPVAVSSTACDLAGGRGVLSVVRNLTERAEAESARAEAEAARAEADAAKAALRLQHETTIEALSEGVVLWSIGSDGGLEPALVSSAAEAILGPGAGGVLPSLVGAGDPLPMWDADGVAIGPADLPVCVTARTGRSVVGFVWGLGIPGAPVAWLRSSARPLLDAGGQPSGVVFSLADITAEHDASRRLQAAEARFGALVAHSSELLAVLDAEGLVRCASPAYVATFGEVPDRRVGHPLVERCVPEDRESLASALGAVLADPGAHRSLPVRVLGADRQARHLRLTVANHLGDPFVAGIVVTARDVTEKVEAGRWLAHQATHDALTGLPNRVLLVERLTTLHQRTGRAGAGGAVLSVDIDQFKHVNDSLGHDAGDRLLVLMAQRLGMLQGPDDVVCRVGGDEYVFLADEVGSVRDAISKAEAIRAVISQPVALDGVQVTVTCSIGIALTRDEEPSALLRQSGTALNKAKERGRNRFEVYEPRMQSGARQRIDTEGRIRSAVRDGGLIVHYQPIVRLSDGSMAGREALVRLRNGTGEVVKPADFISIAEETDLIVDIGSAVLKQACRQQALWRGEAGAGRVPQLSVNVSARQLRSPALLAEVTAVIAAASIPPEQLCLELTESALIDADSTSRSTIAALADLGVSIALDDFGTGWSSLAYLRRFPISVLKIDRSFIGGLGVDPGDTEVVRAVVGLGQALRLRTVAEGVETEDQAELLRSIGCELGQGYWFGKAAPPVLAGAG